MKHDYDTGQLIDTLHSASRTVPVALQLSPNDLRTILDILPEPDPQPADEWEGKPLIEANDVRPGDHIRIAIKGNDAYEVHVTGVDKIAIGWASDHIYKNDISSIRLLSRPVEHPDPAEHPVILIREAVVKHDPPVVAIAMRERVCNELIYVFGEYGSLSPTKITSWSPAKVAPTNE